MACLILFEKKNTIRQTYSSSEFLNVGMSNKPTKWAATQTLPNMGKLASGRCRPCAFTDMEMHTKKSFPTDWCFSLFVSIKCNGPCKAELLYVVVLSTTFCV